ncbi:MAG: bifunctional serine/threonine-protein kinase/formylglycine-generating enzyme family protein [bacterium]|nr:bifunctional serine/threonine-protein kinase/formylglycine-generating enzyme family protein [bacterium]
MAAEPPAPDRNPDPFARLRRVQELFDAASALPAPERNEYLRRETAGDDALAAEVRELLDVDNAASTGDLRDEQSPGLLAQPELAHDGPAPAEPAPEEDLRQHLPRIDDHPVLDTYVILRFVGRGGFGQVFRGRHLLTDRDVAIKLLAPGFMAGTEALDQLRREARIGATTLRHPNIVEVIDCSRRHRLHYLVMEWIRGENLAQRVKRLGPRPLPEVLAILRDLASALAAAHERTVSHRDVNPNNVLLEHTGTAKLTDFGLARHRTDPALMRSDQPIGTPFFVAPEQRERLHDAETPADVYGATATAFYLLTGATPPAVDDDDHSQTIATELSEVAPSPVVRLLRRGLARAPADRPADGSALARELATVLDELRIEPGIAPETLAFAEPPLALSEAELDRMRERIGASRDLGEVVDPAPAAAPAPVDDDAAAGAPVRRWGWVGLLVALVAVAVWRFIPPNDSTPGNGNSSANPPQGKHDYVNGDPKPTGTPKTVGDGKGAGSDPDGDPERRQQPDTNAGAADTKRTEPPPSAPSLEQIVVADQAPLTVGDEVLACALPGLDFGSTRPVSIVVRGVFPSATELELTMGEHRFPPQDRTPERARFQLTPAPGSHEFEIRLGDRTHRVRLEIPSIPPVIAGLDLTKTFEDLGVHYRHPLSPTATQNAIAPLRFVTVRVGLLAGVTEVSRAQFDAFVWTADYKDMLATDKPFEQWLASVDEDLEWRLAFWRKRLRSPAGTVHDPDLPVCYVHASEAAAYARWLSRGIDGHQVVLPDYALWCEIANATFGNPPTATGAMPFQSARHEANYRPDGGDFRGNDGREQRPRASLESVWRRSQGDLHLRHIGGNVAELVVESHAQTPPAGAPTHVAFLGGAFDEERTALAIPPLDTLRFEPTSPVGKRSHSPSANGGFRLAIIPNP